MGTLMLPQDHLLRRKRDGLDKTAELGTLVASTVFNPYSLNGVYWLPSVAASPRLLEDTDAGLV